MASSRCGYKFCECRLQAQVKHSLEPTHNELSFLGVQERRREDSCLDSCCSSLNNRRWNTKENSCLYQCLVEEKVDSWRSGMWPCEKDCDATSKGHVLTVSYWLIFCFSGFDAAWKTSVRSPGSLVNCFYNNRESWQQERVLTSGFTLSHTIPGSKDDLCSLLSPPARASQFLETQHISHATPRS